MNRPSVKKVAPRVKMSAPAETPGNTISFAEVEEMTATADYPRVLTESFNATLLSKCIKHPSLDEEVKTQLKKYLAASKPLEGVRRQIRVRYDFSKSQSKTKYGRVYAPATPFTTLQMMKRKVRNTIAGEYCWDLDMSNAQPTLLLQIAASKGWSCPLLTRYCNEREAILAETRVYYGIDRDGAKDLFIAILYGGGEEGWRNRLKLAEVETMPFAAAFSKEMGTLSQLINTEYPQHVKAAAKALRDKGKEQSAFNVRNSTMSLLLQTEEHKCLAAADLFLSSINRPFTTLIFDGGHIQRLADETECPQSLLTQLETAVKNTTGYKTAWVCKSMTDDDDVLDVSGIECNEEELKSLTGEIDDLFAAHQFVELMGVHIARDGDTILCFNPRTGMWENGEQALLSAVIRHAASLVFTETFVDNKGNPKEKKHNYGGDIANIKSMLKLVPMLVPDTRFIERNGDSSMYYMLFEDGIYNFKTGVFTYGFAPEIVFFASIKRKFQPRAERDETLIAELHDKLFVKPFFHATEDPENDMGKFYLQYLARSIAGEYHHKKMVIGVGNRNTGKGVTTDAMEATFDGYVSTFDANNLLTNDVRKDESQKMMWLKPLRLSRIMIANEVDVQNTPAAGKFKATTRALNGNLINRLAGGGDVVTLRGMHEEDMKVRWRTNVLLLANDMAPISPINEGVIERVRNMRWQKSFKQVTHESELAPNELPADPKMRGIFRADESYRHAFFWIIADAFKQVQDMPFFDPAIVAAETKEWLGEAGNLQIKKALETEYIITGNDKDVVAFDELSSHLHDAGITNMSSTKLGREFTALGLVAKAAHRFADKVKAARCGLRLRNECDPLPDMPATNLIIPGDM